MAIIITSEQTIPIDEPFKVSAGPGAGKTHWLISHIKNVVSNPILSMNLLNIRTQIEWNVPSHIS